MRNKGFNYLVISNIIIVSLAILAITINGNYMRILDYDTIVNNNIVIIVVAFLLIFLTFFLYLRNQHKKIKNISDYIYRILNNDYSLDIREYDEGDINNLKNDIYKVMIKLKNMNDSSMADKKYLESILSDISHQIKTPLTSMYVMNDLLYNPSLEENLRKEFLNKNKAQLERIEWLVSSLLKISRLDSGMATLKKEKIIVKDLIEVSLEPLLIPMELREVMYTVNVDEDITFIGDFKWTSEALINIIKNAYEHSSRGSTIGIKVSDNPLYTEIVISDSGEGIPLEHRKKIFERFFKGSSNKESIGIGLNMALMIVEKQNGTIDVESTTSVGTSFIIRFYKKNI